MDVILDANIYYQLLNGAGRKFVETHQFAELLAYLRRANAHLVIPLMTFHEVVERYRDLLKARASAARKAWFSLRDISMSDIGAFREPSVNHEVNELRKLLRRPAEGVRARIYAGYGEVSVHEVVRRGIKRIRPADDEGEELRDVVLWLAVLRYAQQSGEAVAFISNDSTFVNAEERGLHETLQRDVAEAGVGLSFCRSIGDFVAANALEEEPLTQEFLARFMTPHEIEETAREQVAGLRLPQGTTRSVEVQRVELSGGKRYRVGEDNFYLEAMFKGQASLKVQERRHEAVPGVFTTGPSVAQQGWPIAAATLHPSGLDASGLAYGFATLAGPRVLMGSSLLPQNPFVFTTGKQGYYRETFVELDYACSFDLELSVRILDGRRASVQAERIAIRDMTKSEEAPR